MFNVGDVVLHREDEVTGCIEDRNRYGIYRVAWDDGHDCTWELPNDIELYVRNPSPPLVESPVDVDPPTNFKFKIGDSVRHAKHNDNRRGRIFVRTRTNGGLEYQVIWDDGNNGFYHEQSLVRLETGVSTRNLQIADALVDAHTTDSVLQILSDYRLI